MKLEVTVNGRPGKIEIDGDRFRYDNIERVCSVTPLSPGSYSVLIEGRSYEVLTGPEIRVNGRPFTVEVFDPRSMRGRKSAGSGSGPQKIAAMMPGKVIRLLASVGDAVEQGQGLIVVEAMKMQNEMKAPKSGRVSEIKTKPEATVSPGEVLMVIE